MELKVFCGNAHADLARQICDRLGICLGDATVRKFADGEIDIKVNDDVRGSDSFIIQPTCPPVNTNLMELLMLIDCLRRASASRITAVLPYFGYARKDRKDEGRVPITAKLVANLITTAGADRVLAMDLHAAQIQGFFDIPVDHIFAAPVLVRHFQEMELHDLVVASPDVGSIKMARAYANRLHADLAVVDKRRVSGDASEVVNVIGRVEGKNVVIVDDMISTGGTITNAARALVDRGARQVFLGATHAVLCGNAMRLLREAPVQSVVVTDTIPVDPEKLRECSQLRVLTISELLGEAIRRIHKGQSVSSLFL
ncbi:MAG: ribose-phosphate pyrophosphokinase [Planctomycetes bacterium]|nr:ribose-phosphate pyrophosphokinase [Planctomycetota bacterium]